MIHIVNANNRTLYLSQIAEMHRVRKQQFVDRLGWTGPTVLGDQEHDIYDDDLAEYLLGLDPRSLAVRAGVRMRPALHSSLLADVFPHLVDGGRDRVLGPTTWEATRLFAAPEPRNEEDRQLMHAVYVAMVEFGLLRGFERFTGLGEVRHLPIMRAGTWRTTVLGAPVEDEEGEWYAFEARVDREALTFARERRGFTESLLIERVPVDGAPVSRLPTPTRPQVCEGQNG